MMKIGLMFWGVVCVVAGVSPATVVVDRVPTSGTSATVTPLGSGKYRVELETTRSDTPTTFTVRGASTDQVEDITITANVPQSVFLAVRGNTAGTTIQSVEAIDMGTSTATVIVSELRTSGNVDRIEVNTIQSANIGGDLVDGITLLERTHSGLSELTSVGVLGDVLGPIDVSYGAMKNLVVTGSIGTSTTPVAITVRDNILNLEASEIYADVVVLSPTGGFIKRLVTTTGSVVGSIEALRIDSDGFGTPGLFIAGDLDADVTVSDVVYHPINIGGDFKAGRTLNVGVGLQSSGDIAIGNSTGLKGQINIGTTNPGTQFWVGDVTVGSTTLTTKPYYSQLSTALGGGSVGLVKFNFHGAECSPANGAGLNSAPSQVLIEHYGPVSIPTGNPPVKVEEAEDSWPIGGSPSWTDVTADYDYAIASGTGRKLQITPKSGHAFNSGSLYRISPAGASSTNRLKCAGVTGSPDAVYVYDATQAFFDNYYHFAVYFSGFDLNQSGEVDGVDVVLWMLAPLDLDEDDDADADDLNLLEAEAGF